MINNKEIAKVFLKNNIKNFLKKYHIKHIFLFGSYADGTNYKDSDIDIGYELEEGKQLGWEINDIIVFLQNEFKKKVDFVEAKYLKKEIKDYVLSNKIDIF